MLTLWMTGYSGAGKTTLADALRAQLRTEGRPCAVLDGDRLRAGLNRDLGFSPADRSENIRRTAEVARLMNDAGLIVVCALVSPLREHRETARRIIGSERFMEIHVSTRLEICEERDPKGLYRRARAGDLPDLTGIGSPYEAPAAPALRLETERSSLAANLQALMALLPTQR